MRGAIIHGRTGVLRAAQGILGDVGIPGRKFGTLSKDLECRELLRRCSKLEIVDLRLLM